MSVQLDKTEALKVAQKFTEIAIERNLINHAGFNPEDSAANVVSYLNTIFEAIHDPSFD